MMHLLKLIGNYFLTEAVGVRVVIIYLQYTLSIINEVVISMWNGDGQKLSPLWQRVALSVLGWDVGLENS